MPNSYTLYIQEGKIDNGADFLKLIMGYVAKKEKDTNKVSFSRMDKDIPNTYFNTQINFYKNKLELFSKMTLEEAQKQRDLEYNENINRANQGIESCRINKDKTNKIIKEIKSWETQTTDQKALKDWAINMLTSYIELDCNDNVFKELLETPKQTVGEYIDSNIKDCTYNINYYTENMHKERKKLEQKNYGIDLFERTLSTIKIEEE